MQGFGRLSIQVLYKYQHVTYFNFSYHFHNIPLFSIIEYYSAIIFIQFARAVELFVTDFILSHAEMHNVRIESNQKYLA